VTNDDDDLIHRRPDLLQH